MTGNFKIVAQVYNELWIIYTGSKAVDFLLDSKWASGEKGTKILFTDRNSVVRYLDEK